MSIGEEKSILHVIYFFLQNQYVSYTFMLKAKKKKKKNLWKFSKKLKKKKDPFLNRIPS